MSSDLSSDAEALAVELSVVVPAYNEERRIGPTLEQYIDLFGGSHPGGFELITVVNGCTDGTRRIVEDVARNAPQIRIIEFVRPLGKGGAIWEGMAVALGDKVAFVDADNMVRAPETAKLIRALDTHDIAIGDRYSGVRLNAGRSIARDLITFGSRRWVRFFLGLPYSDTQCGAKAFRAAAWRAIAPNIVERGWAFDLDVLAHARRLGFTVAETPVTWEHIAEGSKVHAWKDVPQTFLATFRIRQRAGRG